MIIFLIKSASCMATFLIFYKLFLEKESMHRFKRFYLLSALLVSFIIPSVVFTEVVVATPINFSSETPTLYDTQIVQTITTDSKFNWELALWSLYGIGVFGFGFRFFRHLIQIGSRVRKNPKLKNNFSVKVLLQEQLPPHTFFNYIFLNRQKFETKTIPDVVLLHEETHAKQKHSLDVLFIEFLQVIFWFNPIIYLFKKSIKLNHEFLADSAVIIISKDSVQYQNTLLSYLSHNSFNHHQSTGIANAINYSSIKKRFKIMKKETSKKGIVLRSTLLLPLLAILLLGFSETKTIVEKENTTNSVNNIDSEINLEIEKYNTLAKKYNAIPIAERVIPLHDLKLLENTYRSFSATQKEAAQPFPECLPKENQETATSAQLSQYNQLAKKYNEMIGENGNIRILKSDVEQLTYIYGIMSEKQKATAQPFPEFPEPPLPPKAPKVLKGEKSDIPPPPSPKVKKGEKSNIPPPPLTPKTAKSPKKSDYANAEIKRIIKTQDPYDQNNLNINSVSGIPKSTVTFYSSDDKQNQNFITEDNMRVYINNSSSTKTDNSSNLLEYLKSLAKKNAQFYFNAKEVSIKEGLKIVKNKKNIFVETLPYSNQKPKVKIYTNKNDISIPPPPVPPTPTSPLDYTISMAKKGATFMYEDEEISSDKAIELLKQNKKLNIKSRNRNGKQIIRITKNPVTIK